MANEFSPVSLGALLFFAVVMIEGTQWTAIFYVNVNTRLYNAMQGVICGEDDNMLTHCVTHRHKQIDSVCLGSLEMFGITTVNMQHICIINMLKKVRAKLISKQQSRCHNNNGSGLFHQDVDIIVMQKWVNFVGYMNKNQRDPFSKLRLIPVWVSNFGRIRVL